MIVFSIQIKAPDENRTLILRTLSSILEPTRVIPGCLDVRLYADLDDRKTLRLFEEWESREQFDRHLDLQMVRTLVSAIELASQAPVVSIDEVQRESGVDALSSHRYPLGSN